MTRKQTRPYALSVNPFALSAASTLSLFAFAFGAQAAPIGKPASKPALHFTALRRIVPAPKKVVSPLPPLHYTQFVLPNGLRVIFHIDRSTPIVVTNLWYHVGSKNEPPGRNGFAHLFEHMMFQGSKNYDDEYFNALSSVGGQVNASTAPDRTNFYDVVPSNYLQRVLFLEADRMGGLIDVITKAKFDNQREVVENEKRQSYDNRPYGGAAAKIAAALYPKNHPYSWLTIGSMADLDASTVNDVKAFFRRYYVPNNASLVVAGDFDPVQAKKWVLQYFGPIKRGANLKPLAVPPVKLTAPKKLQMTDRVQLARLYLTWPTVKLFAPGDAALDTLSDVLTNGKTSRLYKTLVYDRQLAQSVGAYQYSRELTGEFGIVVTARPGVSLNQIERVVDAEIAKVAKNGPTQAEIARSYTGREASFVYGLQGINDRADQINGYATYTGDPDYASKDLARYKSITPADVRRAAAQFLGPNRVELRVLPQSAGAGGAPAAPPASATGAMPTESHSQTSGAAQKPDAGKHLPAPGPDPQLSVPRIQRAKLSNGLNVLLVEKHTLPIVALDLAVNSGSEADPRDEPGLAFFTAALLDEGTKTLNSLQLSEAFDAIGANFGAAADFDNSGASITTLTNHLPRALDLFSDVVLHPAFPPTEIERQRALLLNRLQSRRDDAGALSGALFPQLLFGKDHPYGHPTDGTEEAARKVTRNDIAKFYQTYWRPNNATLIVVGDTTLKQIQPLLEAKFKAWQPAPVPTVDTTAPPAPDHTGVFLVDKPGAPQSVVTVGSVGLSRTDPDFFAARVLNMALGGQFASRINLNLREDKGYTYGTNSYFDPRRGPGPFIVEGDIQTNATAPALKEIVRELTDIQKTRPLTETEAEISRDALVRGFNSGFETAGDVAQRLELLSIYGLPDNYFQTYTGKIRSVTVADAERAANLRLHPDALTVLIVGDVSKIEAPLRDAGYTVVRLDEAGNSVGD